MGRTSGGRLKLSLDSPEFKRKLLLFFAILMTFSLFVLFDLNRLDVKAQTIDKGYPKFTDVVFGGIPSDAHDVFQYQGK